MALRLFRHKGFIPGAPTRRTMVVHRSIEGEWKQDLTTVELGRPLSEVLSEITFDEIGTGDPAPHAAWIIDRLSKIGVCFSAGDQGQGSRLLLAGQWLFDSYVGQNDLLSFVQTMIALEILLGARNDRTCSVSMSCFGTDALTLLERAKRTERKY
jgi:hypothetical protein